MLKLIAHWIERAFAPAFELLRDVPPRALNRLFAPF
jgi:hypothetical protein